MRRGLAAAIGLSVAWCAAALAQSDGAGDRGADGSETGGLKIEVLPRPAPDPQFDAPAPRAAPSGSVQSGALAPFEPSREDAVLEAFVDGVVAAHRREHKTPGVAVSVVRDGRVLFAKGYGVANAASGARVDGGETLFRIGSVSKLFIWTAAMMLSERGALDLDVDVNQYLEDIEVPPAFDAPITMNHLMAHRAGFEDAFAVYTYRDDAPLLDPDALRRDMPARVFPPGARTSYSNYGSALAAKVVEDIAGVPYTEFVRREILTPLSMTRTSLVGPSAMNPSLRPLLSDAFSIENGAPVASAFMQIGPYAPAGVIASSAADMARYMLLHLGRGEHDGVQLMSRASHETLWTRAFDDRPLAADLAHGFMTRPYRGVTVYGHGGATAGFYTNMALTPELGLGVFVSQNAANGRDLVMDLPVLVIDHVLRADPAPATATAAASTADAADFVGVYLANRRSFRRFEKILALNQQTAVEAADGGALIVKRGGDSAAYAPVGPDTFEDADGGRIAFGRVAGGAVDHFVDPMGVHSYERVGFFARPAFFMIALGASVFFAATTLLGVWRRQAWRAADEITGRRDVGPGGVFVVATTLVAAAVTFAFIGAIGVAALTLNSVTAADYPDYPPAAVTAVRIVAHGLFASAIVGLFALIPAWRGGLSIWRKLHHTAFALSLGALAAALVLWNFVLAPSV